MNYADMTETVRRLITEMGKPVTVRNYSAMTYDPVTMVQVPGTPVDTAGYAVEEQYGTKEIDGTLIQQGDRKFLLSSTVAPTVASKLVVSSVEMNIISVSPVQPGIVTIYYIVQVRQ